MTRVRRGRFVVSLLLTAVSACGGVATRSRLEPAPDAVVRVLVFNIHAGKDAAGTRNLEGVADLIRSTAADLALIQEVDRGTRRSGGVDQPLVIATRSGFAAAFGRSLDYDGGQYGIAALARDGFTAQFTESLPVAPIQTRAGGSHEPRAALVVAVRTAIGTVTALNTHLDASRDEGYRLQEIKRILDLMARTKRSGMPSLAAGDFNAEPGSEVHKRVLASGLRDAWLECGSGEGLTYPADKPVKRIDYVFLADPLHCTDARVIETTISDHRPVIVSVGRRR
jgi:endonuclease/exonuclease/phosphatase family metal-dependent hydrolase